MAAVFGNPVMAGNNLARTQMQSPNYVLNVTGWAIRKDGTAQFTGVVLVGGSFTGSNFVINSSGEFFYDGAPAAGNLIISNAPAAGTDAKGNAYLIGITSYNHGISPIQATQIYNGAVGLYTAATEAGPYSLIGFLGLTASGADVQVSGQGSVTNSNIQLFPGFAKAVIVNANGTSGQNQSVFRVVNGLAAPISPASQLIAAAAADRVLGIMVAGDTSNRLLIDSNGKITWGSGTVQDTNLYRAAASILQTDDTLYVPTMLQASSANTPETWHNFGAPIAGWAVGTMRYKLLADSGLVIIEMDNLQPPGAPPVDGTTIFTVANGLPAAYRPSIARRLPTGHGAGAGGEQTQLSFNLDGSVNVYGVGGTTVARMDGTFILSTI